jgi:hypothetical protein
MAAVNSVLHWLSYHFYGDLKPRGGRLCPSLYILFAIWLIG